jgi:hypothetical protein
VRKVYVVLKLKIKNGGIMPLQNDPNLKVFISSTYLDLIDYRKAIIEQLNRMKVAGVMMEYMGSSESEPSDVSLEELNKCNIYLGIIGHRYGTEIKGKDKSIVQCEYDRALELYNDHKMRLLIYLADDTVPLPKSLIEPDNLRKKLDEFRRNLKSKHTTRLFKTPDEIAAWVSADLYNLRYSRLIPDLEITKIFEAGDWDVIKDEFDSLADERFSRIQYFLEFLADSFVNLFNIDRKQLEIHPIFKNVTEQLKNIIPGISLDDEGGILRRTGVRHVILRTETALILMNTLKGNLFDLGEQIGESAAIDLIKHTVEAKQLIPASAEALLTLWDYWDRTGGWGKLSLLESSHSGNPNSQQQFTWRIKIENNFLVAGDAENTHELCEFWCGYIRGFLNFALPKISEHMTEKLSDDQRQKVTLPAYRKVDSVKHEIDSNKTQDIFDVTFKWESLSEARRALSICKKHISKEDYYSAILSCQAALISIKRELVQSKFQTELECMYDKEKSVINQIDSNPEFDIANEAKAKQWFNAMNTFIQNLVAEKKMEVCRLHAPTTNT